MKLAKYLLAFFLLFSGFTYGQDKATPLEKMLLESMAKIGSLQFEGKFEESFPLMLTMEEALKKAADTDKKNKERYIAWLMSEAAIYQVSGNYKNAELQIKKALSENETLNDGNVKKSCIYQLALIYEKLGNFSATRDQLEELVIMEYPELNELDEKSVFIKSYINLYKSINQNLIKTQQDSLQYVRLIESMWDDRAKSIKQDKAGDVDPMAQQTGLLVLQSLMKQTREAFKVTKPLNEQVAELRKGNLKLDGMRNGAVVIEPWAEVQKLFQIYRKEKNYVAAEALIKAAIRVDKTHINDGTMSTIITQQTLSATSFTGELFKRLGVNIDNDQKIQLVNNITYINGLFARYSGVDIFGLQNRALLAQLYKETADKDAFKHEVTSAYSIIREMILADNPLLLNLLGDVCIKLEKYDDAIVCFSKICKFYEVPGQGITVHAIQYLEAMKQLIALYQLKGNRTEAETAIKLSLTFGQQKGLEKYPVHLSNLLTAAQFYADGDQLSDAENYCKILLGPIMKNMTDNFGFLSEKEKISFVNEQVANLNFAVSLLQKKGIHQEDFVTDVYNQQLLIKGLVLNDQKKILDRVRKTNSSSISRVFDEWKSNRTAIAWLYYQTATATAIRKIDSLTKIANDQEKKINQLSSIYTELRQDQKINTTTVRQKLIPGEAAVEFLRFEQYNKGWTGEIMYAAFVVLPEDAAPRFFPLCSEKELADLLSGTESSSKRFIDQLYGNGIDPEKNTIEGRKSDRLFKLLWEPLMSKLSKVNKVYISPAGLLCRLNFNALPFNGTQYMLDRYQIHQLSSIREIAQTPFSPNNQARASVTLFGDVEYGLVKSKGKGWVHLETLNELNEISNLFKNKKQSVKTFTGYMADEQTLYELSGKSPSIIHISTHGFFEPVSKYALGDIRIDDPMFRSGLILANANNFSDSSGVARYDGKATAYEIANLDLSNSELLTLTACETALGDIENTEGVFGLQRAFKLAGVKNMLLGLWNLPLLSTNKFITAFYNNRVNQNLSIYDSFNTSQKQLRKIETPYNWAGMVLIE